MKVLGRGIEGHWWKYWKWPFILIILLKWRKKWPMINYSILKYVISNEMTNIGQQLWRINENWNDPLVKEKQ